MRDPNDWQGYNLQLRADRDFVHDTARKAAEARVTIGPRTHTEFLALADRFADQQREMAAQAERHGWR